MEEAYKHLYQIKTKHFSILNLNIRSLNKNFDNLKILLNSLSFDFKIICLTETWCKDKNISNNSLFQLPNYRVIHQIRNNNCNGGGVCIFIHESLNFKLRNDLSACDDNSEILSIEIINRTTKNIIINTIYRPPVGKIKPFKNTLKDILSKNSKSNKTRYLVGDLNLNVIDYSQERIPPRSLLGLMANIKCSIFAAFALRHCAGKRSSFRFLGCIRTAGTFRPYGLSANEGVRQMALSRILYPKKKKKKKKRKNPASSFIACHSLYIVSIFVFFLCFKLNYITKI